MIRLKSYTVLTVFTVDLLATSGDITSTWPSPMFPKLLSNDSSLNPLGRPITEGEESWIGSLVSIGAIVGPFPYGFISDKFGRKLALLAVAIPHIASYLMLAFSQTIELYYVARVLGGIALGGGYTLLPMYVAEVAEDSNRGALSVTLNIFWTIGNLLPYVTGPYVPVVWFNIILACVPAAFFLLFFLVAPESPYYLVGKKRISEAEESLMRLRSTTRSGVEKEVKHIQEVMAKDEHGTVMDLFRTRANIKALFISLVLLMTQQLTGINAILAYTQLIFQASGNVHISDEVSSIIVGAMFVISSLFAPFLADRLGRRPLLLISAVMMTIALAGLGTFYYFKESTDEDISSISSWLPLLSLTIFIFGFNIGYASIAWTVSSELFPNSVKSVSASLVAATCWGTSFLVMQFFNDMSNALGKGGTFWFYGGCCLLATVFVYFFVPETRGKSFREIQEELEGKKSTNRANSDGPQI